VGTRKEGSDAYPPWMVLKGMRLQKWFRLRPGGDLESDWTVKNDKPHYGLKEHASVDVTSGFVLATTLTPASEHDSKYLPYLTIASCHTEEPIEKVYGDKGYYGEPNRTFLHMNGIKDGLRLVEASLRLGENNA
ncbi:MAG: transposase, partial [Deltaproteobacteria bacterium]|nr:transposase [Deltaproteobacteria bacterium]